MAITRSQQAKQMLQDGGMLVKPGFGGMRQGYRGDAAAAAGAPGTADAGPAGDPGEGPASGQGPASDDRSDFMGSKGKTRGPTGKTDRGGFSLSSLTPISVRLAKNLFNKLGPKGIKNPNVYERAKLDFMAEEDDDTPERGDEAGIRSAMRFNPMMTAASMMNPMTPQQGIGALDLNRIAYRFMADGGFLEDTDEARQAYGLGSIVKKAFKTVRKPFKAVTKTLKKVAKSPTGKLLLAVAAPYALGPAMAQASFLQGLTAAQQAALISGATTGITQLATGEDLDFKDIALSAAIGGASAKAFPAGGAKPGTQQGFSRPTMADVAGPSLPKTSPAFTRPTMADIAGPSRTRGLSGIEDYGNLIDVASPAKTSAFTRPTMADIAGPTSTSTFTRPTMADVGVTGMPSVKQSLSEKLLASSRRGLSAIKDSKLTDILLRNDEGKLSPLKVALLGSGIAGLAAAKGMGQEELEEQDRGESIDFAAIRRRPFDTLAPRFAGSQFDFYAAEGGQAKKEPVAKKVMPLLDMGGMEKDYRAEGGFVPIGRMEKADDVPARLSKNEFVFTADAVRNAGDGDVDKGAEVMYNMMKNLEAGGDVSEESQGLEGARRMFQTSQRLEEVL
jgi:hypothetical protein